MILDHAAEAVKAYNERESGYNRVADAIYRFREVADPFSPVYEPRIVGGLRAFRMGRRMGTDFGSLRRNKLAEVREHLDGVPLVCLDQVDLNRMDAKEAHFHVGATKILHWIAAGLRRIGRDSLLRPAPDGVITRGAA
jgi:hypothetical protein